MIGIIPAGGKATRMNGLPKFLLPTPEGTLFDVMCKRMESAGVSRVWVASSDETAGALFPYCNESRRLYRTNVPTMSEAVMNARTLIPPDFVVGFGMPDTYFDDASAFSKLDDAVLEGQADIAVGVFKVRPQQHRKLGMCRIEGRRIVEVVDKPQQTDLEYAWGVLAWDYRLWSRMRPDDPHIGYALPRAIEERLDVRAVFMDGEYFDCGTPDEYFECINHVTRGCHER